MAGASHRGWADLPSDILTAVFRKLGGIEVLWRAQAVCRQWRQLAVDPLFWRIIDMGNHSDLFKQIDVEVLTRMAVDRCGGVLEELYLDYSARPDRHQSAAECSPDLYMDYSVGWLHSAAEQPPADRRDPLLNYVADRTTGLKRVALISAYHVWDEALVEFVTCCPLLEELQITNFSSGDGAIEEVGLACPHLKCFRLNDAFDEEESDYLDDVAIEIADGMPHLRELQLVGNLMTNEGLHAILDKCLQLESLDIRACLNVKLDAQLSQKLAKIQKVKLPNDSTDDYEFPTRQDVFVDDDSVCSVSDLPNFSSYAELMDYLNDDDWRDPPF